MSQLKIVKVNTNSSIPTKGSLYSAGHDLYSCEHMIVKPKKRVLVNIGIIVGIPEGCYGRIAPRSGLSYKNSIDIGAGVIDIDYRGELKVLLINNSDEDFTINIGDRIAQLICEKIHYCDVLETKELDKTERNDKGFGSSII